MKIKKTILQVLSIFFSLSISLSCVSCAIPIQNTQNNITVSWMNSDGTLLETNHIASSEKFEERELPADTDEWHYTGWKIVSSGDVIICIAQRVKKVQYIWKDHNGTIIQESTGFESEVPTAPELPSSTNQWKYTEWSTEITEDSYIYTIQRTPNEEYFLGNVFQIVLNDENGKPISTGSGFIFHEDGWFITNNHVMDGGSSASAFFDIPDSNNGKDYTQLSVLGGIYNSDEMDIFIGKLDNYEQIDAYYQPITLSVDYTLGETTYTIGYPNSSLFMQINEGTLLEEYKDIYGKIYDSYYLLSDSYIAPGSSGGILINENFEVLGITTIGLYADSTQSVYLAGGSVPTNHFLSYTQNLKILDLKPLNEIYTK